MSPRLKALWRSTSALKRVRALPAADRELVESVLLTAIEKLEARVASYRKKKISSRRDIHSTLRSIRMTTATRQGSAFGDVE